MEYVSVPFHDDDSDVQNSVETLSVLEAARRAGVTQSAIVRWIRNGYLQATPSSNGWQIPAHLLDDAQRAADTARGTGPVPRRTSPTLEPAPTPIRRSMESRSVDIPATMPAGIEAIGESVVAPLAELIRDQIDVVHDQAEVIGWLQAERERLAREVADLKKSEHPVDVDSAVESSQLPAEPSRDQDDSLVSLLWKNSADAFDQIEGLRVLGGDETTTGFSTIEQEPEADAEPVTAQFDDWFVETDQVETVEVPEPVEEPPVLRIEDYADPSWFFSSAGVESFREPTHATERPSAVLKPIVPRSKSEAPATTGIEDDPQLRQMMDETERKIAELWQNEEQLRQSRPASDNGTTGAVAAETERGSIWQRLFPSRR